MPAVLITGANRGLGLEFCRQYAASGWDVLAASRSSSEELEELGKLPKVTLYSVDVGDSASVQQLADALGDQPIDVLINNAGYFGCVGFAEGGVEHQAFGDTDFDNWANVMNINVFGPMRVTEALVDNVAASEQKKVVTLSSMLGSMELNTIGGLYAYRSSKAAVNMMMKSMAVDLQKRGVLAVAVHPGWAKTEMGGPGAEVEPGEGVAGLRRVIERLTEQQLGQLIAFDGNILPY